MVEQHYVPVVQWIEWLRPKEMIAVRIRSGIPYCVFLKFMIWSRDMDDDQHVGKQSRPAASKAVKLSSLASGLLFVVLSAAIVGMYLWQHHKVTQLQAKYASSTQSTVSGKEASTQKYLYLYDYSLKIPLTDDLQDLYFADTKYDSKDILAFSTQSIANADPGCAAVPSGYDTSFLSYQFTTDAFGTDKLPVGDPFGSILVQKKPLASEDIGSTDGDIGMFIVHAGDYYFYHKSPQASCSKSEASYNMIKSQKAAFLDALKHIKPISE